MIVEEHRRLLTHLARKANARLDDESHASGPQSLRELLPGAPLQHHAKVRHRYVSIVDLIVMRALWFSRIQMRDELVTEEVEIDPLGGAAAFGATQQFAIESARGGQVVNRYRKVKRLHYPLTPCPTLDAATRLITH